MTLTKDQKKHLFIGGGLGAAALFVGNWLLGSRRAIAAPLFSPPEDHEDHRHHERKPHHVDRDDSERGTYGRGKHDRHRGGRD